MNLQSPPEKLKPADFASDQEIRWCPGCGDYAIVKSVHRALAELGAELHNKGKFEPQVVTDGRLVTGQNPPSSEVTAKAVVDALYSD